MSVPPPERVPGPPRLSVVVVTWNSAAEIGPCLGAVARAARGIPSEVLVVDNASTDPTPERVRAYAPGVRLLALDRNLGFAAASNRGIRATTGEAVLLLNPDTVPAPDALEAALRPLRADPAVGVVGARLLAPDGAVQETCVMAFRSLWDELCLESGLFRLFPGSRLFDRHRMLYHDFDRSGPVDVVGGAFLLLRREALAEVGLLDEDLFLYGEEEDLCRRMAAAGWRVWYAADAQVVHLGARSTGRSELALHATYWRSRDRVTRKHAGPLRTTAVRAIRSMGMVRRLLSLWRRVLLGREERARARAVSRELWSSLLLQARPPRKPR